MYDGRSVEPAYVVTGQYSSPAAFAISKRLKRDLGTKLKQLEIVQRKFAKAQQSAQAHQRTADRLAAEIEAIRLQVASLESHYAHVAVNFEASDLDSLSSRTLAWLQRLSALGKFGMPDMRRAASDIEWDASDNHIRVIVSSLKRRGIVESVARGRYRLTAWLKVAGHDLVQSTQDREAETVPRQQSA